MELALIIIGAVLLCTGFYALFNRTKTRPSRAVDEQSRTRKLASPPTKIVKPPRCPVCSSILNDGERVKSMAVSFANGEKLLHISGCPHCLYGEEKRTCPVCFAEITRDEILTAKMTIKDGKNNVKVFGCSHCGGKAASWM
ncbi:MAG: hypothetical protein LBK73_03965 [Treponema sp.]|jgi:hypothetical protein|nr:hypothetical protein [Treponema sp.]